MERRSSHSTIGAGEDRRGQRRQALPDGAGRTDSFIRHDAAWRLKKCRARHPHRRFRGNAGCETLVSRTARNEEPEFDWLRRVMWLLIAWGGRVLRATVGAAGNDRR